MPPVLPWCPMSSEPRSPLPRLLQSREAMLFALIAFVVVFMSLASPHFLSMANFRAMAAGLVPTGIIVVGMTYLLVSGGFDLSVGSVVALASTVCAYLLTLGFGIPEAVIGSLLLGALAGGLNGVLVTGLNINPLIATLGTMSIARGIALIMTEGFSLSSLPRSFGLAGNSSLFGLPAIVWIMLAVVAAGDFALRRMTFFRQIYFVGSNEQAARLSGIDVARVRIAAYVLSGVLASLAGVLLASRLMSGTPTAGSGLELQVLAAAVIGGASLKGGEGTVLGAFLGAVFVALVSNAMTMLAVSIYWQMIVTGAILVAAVGIDMLSARGRLRRV
jgi:ribose transport system permease protein